MKINVLYSEWVADGTAYAAGENDLGKPSNELLKLVAGAVSAGAVEVTEGDLDLDAFVETQEASEKALTEAMGTWVAPEYQPNGTRTPGYWDGPWAEGHYAQVAADAEARLAPAEIDVDVEETG